MPATKKAQRKRALKVAAAHLDDIELDRAFAAALRGDMDEVDRRLSRVKSDSSSEQPKFSWRDTSSWLFNRSPFPPKR